MLDTLLVPRGFTQVATIHHTVMGGSRRLLDLIDSKDVSLSKVVTAALDECDKMLSLGFAQELARVRTLLLEPATSGAAGRGVAIGASKHSADDLSEMKVHTTADGAGDGAAPGISKKRRKRQRGAYRQDVMVVIITW